MADEVNDLWPAGFALAGFGVDGARHDADGDEDDSYSFDSNDYSYSFDSKDYTFDSKDYSFNFEQLGVAVLRTDYSWMVPIKEINMGNVLG